MVFRTLPTLTVCAAALVSGAVSGLWAHRWAPASDLGAAVARLAVIPETVGEWDGRPADLPARELEVAQVAGGLRRDYVNRRTGAAVSLLLLCGRPGPVSVHTPDVCYRGSGFEEAGPPAQSHVPGGDGRFLVRNFQKQAAAPVRLRVWYAWNATGEWECPDNPRWHFARQKILYKIYVVRELSAANEPLDSDPGLEFLRTLVPQVGPALFPSQPPTAP